MWNIQYLCSDLLLNWRRAISVKTAEDHFILHSTLWERAHTVVQRKFPQALRVQMLLYDSMFHRYSLPSPVWQRPSCASRASLWSTAMVSFFFPLSYGAPWINCLSRVSMDFLYRSNALSFFFLTFHSSSHICSPQTKKYRSVFTHKHWKMPLDLEFISCKNSLCFLIISQRCDQALWIGPVLWKLETTLCPHLVHPMSRCAVGDIQSSWF